MNQSNYVYHIYSNLDAYHLINYAKDTDLELNYDNRNKIEDLDTFVRGLYDVLDEKNLIKFKEYLDLYLKFEND